MTLALLAVGLPLGFALAVLAVRGERLRAALLPSAALAQLLALGWLLRERAALAPGPADWLGLDPLGALLLGQLAVLFAAVAAYAPAYLRLRPERPQRLFCAMLLVCVAMMNLSAIAQHVGLLWIAVEATALAAAPLLGFNHTPRSIEATWKYLLTGGVGIALALLGSFFLGYAVQHAGLDSALIFAQLRERAPELGGPWLRAAFALLLVGYGTKMGLAPMHTWKPDAYGEAPGLVGALLAGGAASCAFGALLRFCALATAAGEGAFARELLLAFGLLSMGVGAVFALRQHDYKRLLAYSSVEQMGVLVIGAALGTAGLFGALLHMLASGLCKAVLFLAAASLHRELGSRSTREVRGALRAAPRSALLLGVGFVAATGSPPFAPFVSEFAILRAAVGAGELAVAALFLALLLLAFTGMGGCVLALLAGEPQAERAPRREPLAQFAPPAALLALVLALGLWLPSPLSAALWSAARYAAGEP